MPTIAAARDAALVSITEEHQPAPTPARRFGRTTVYRPRRRRRLRITVWCTLLVALGCTAVLVVTHSATAMALSARMLGLDQTLHVFGPLANCHWSELTCEDGMTRWRMRAHNIGSPGTVVPMPLAGPVDDAPDADA